MDFQIGDPVMHWTYGLGEIVGLEERALTSENKLYYVVRVQNMTVCVPADGKAGNRLRPPTPQGEFEALFTILGEPGGSLSEDRLERKNLLRKDLSDGKVETICRVIRDLSFYSKKKALNDDEKDILKRAWTSLCGEWGYALSIPLAQVERELNSLLLHPTETVIG